MKIQVFGRGPFCLLALAGDCVYWASAAKKQVIEVIGGYAWMANFMDQKGYVATDGMYDGRTRRLDTQYNFENTLINRACGMGAYESRNTDPKPFDCGVCHTTGYTAEGEPAAEGYAGTDTCKSCHSRAGTHPAIIASFAESGHQHALTAVTGGAARDAVYGNPGAARKFKCGTSGQI